MDGLIGPHVFKGHMTINTYLKLLNRHRPGLLDIIPAPQRDEIIFQKPYEFALHQGFSSCSWLLSPDIVMKMISSYSLFSVIFKYVRILRVSLPETSQFFFQTTHFSSMRHILIFMLH